MFVFQVTYTEDQVVEDEEDAEKEGSAGESKTEITEPESDSKDEGAWVGSFFTLMGTFFFLRRPCSFFSPCLAASVVSTALQWYATSSRNDTNR